jgi:hypothetical protein
MRADEAMRLVYEAIRERPRGVTRRALQQRLGVSDPALEENRVKVWRIAAAVAALIRTRFVLTAVEDGECWLYPQMA